MKDNVFLMADIHGDFKPIRDFYNRHKNSIDFINANKILIILGDAGLNFFFNCRDEKLKQKLGKYPFTYFIIRGNHEERPSICAEKEPDKWTTEQMFDNTVWVEKEYPYIKYALDSVSFYNIDGYKTLIIPGAYSVDKYKRIAMNWSWFPQEQLSLQEQQDGLNLLDDNNWRCDLVLSHTCPFIFEPTDLFLSIVDQSMVDKTMERYLGQIEYNLIFKTWCFGHYHQWREYPRNIATPTVFEPRVMMLYNDAAAELTDIMNNPNLINKL